MEPKEHGPDELYEKFHVYKSCSEVEADETLNAYDKRDRLGVDGEFIFVLRPETNDKAAIAALLEYARVCESSYPGLSAQIVERLTAIRHAVSTLTAMGCTEAGAYEQIKKLRERG